MIIYFNSHFGNSKYKTSVLFTLSHCYFNFQMYIVLIILFEFARSEKNEVYQNNQILRRESALNDKYLLNEANDFSSNKGGDIRVQATISVYDMLPKQSSRNGWTPMVTSRKDDSIEDTELIDNAAEQHENNNDSVPEIPPPPEPYMMEMYQNEPPQMTAIESRLHRQIAKMQTKVKHHHHHHHHNHIKTVHKKIPVEVPVEKIVEKIVERKVPYPVIRRIPYKVEVKTPQPYPVRVVEKEYVHVPKPYPVYKHIPVEVKVPEPYPVEKRVPYPVEVKVPYPVEKKVPVAVPVPYKVEVEKKIPVPIKIYVPQPYPVEKKVPVPVQIKVKEPYPVIKHVPYPVKIPFVRPQYEKPRYSQFNNIPYPGPPYERRNNYPIYFQQYQSLPVNRESEGIARWQDNNESDLQSDNNANLEEASSTAYEMRAPIPISFFIPHEPPVSQL